MAEPAHPDHLRRDYDRDDHLRVGLRDVGKARLMVSFVQTSTLLLFSATTGGQVIRGPRRPST
jgi:hypothetical protein